MNSDYLNRVYFQNFDKMSHIKGYKLLVSIENTLSISEIGVIENWILILMVFVIPVIRILLPIPSSELILMLGVMIFFLD